MAFQPNRIILPGEHLAGKRNEITVRCPEAPGAERRARIEDHFHDAAERTSDL
jgi:hypothetical protein